MALPVFGNAAAASGSITTLTPAMPTGITAGQILLCFATCENGQNVTLTTANGFVATANSPQSAVVAGGIKLYAFWKRAVGGGGDSAPVFADPGDHIGAVIISVSGCISTGNPWDVTSGGAEITSDNSLAVPGATTTVNDCLVVVAVADGVDNTSAARWSAWANADLANVTERVDKGGTEGGGWGLGVATGEKAVAGTYGDTTATFFTANFKAYMTLALKPEPSGTSVSGLGSAAAFGTVTVLPGGVSVTQTGLGSAQQFGAIKANIRFAVSGLGSSQQFGLISLKFQVPSLVSAASFGTPQENIAFTVGGLASAQAFGAPNVSTGGTGETVPVTGLSSASALGTVTPLPGGVVVVLVGLGSSSSFGTPQGNQTKPVGGVPSAAAFGTVGIATGGTVILVPSVGSASQFGSPSVTTPGGDIFIPAIHGGRRR